MAVVSVVIPFFSSIDGLLIKSVRSALEQSFQDIEVIVVDDASPIRAVEQLESIVDPRLRIIEHQVNSNGAIARNTGIDNANGEFIAFLDYDDVWYPDKIKNQVEMMRSLDIEKSNIVIYSSCRIVDGKRSYIRPSREKRIDESVGEYIFCNRELIQTSGLFLCASTAKNIKFDNLKRHQDYQFCLSLEKFGCSFHLMDKVCYDFIQVPKVNDNEYSLFWLSAYKTFLNNKAVKGFQENVILRTYIFHKQEISSALSYSLHNGLIIKFFVQLSRYFLKSISKKLYK